MKNCKKSTAFFIISIIGTLGHFVYELTEKNRVVGLFFPVNESTWEHLKLLFFPAVIYFTVCYFLMSEKPINYISSSFISIIVGMLAIIVIFYTYRGVIGKNIDFLNITIYYIAVLLTVISQSELLGSNKFKTKISQSVALLLTIITVILFATFTYNPPSLGIFLPPIANVNLLDIYEC